MEILKVGIDIDDLGFAKALTKGLARESRAIRFSLFVPGAETDFDLILTSAERQNGRYIRLVKSPRMENLDNAPFRLYCYKESGRMIGDMLLIYYRMTGISLEYRQKGEISLFVFFGERGGCGTTAVSLAAARMLGQIYGKSGLYMNLCPINDSCKYLGSGEDNRLLRLLYYLDRDRNFPIESFISRSGEVDYIGGGVFNPHFSEMKPVLMARLLKRIEQLGQYGFMVLDLGNHLTGENRNLLLQSDAAVFVQGKAGTLPGKYRDEISRAMAGNLDKKALITVHNFAEEEADAIGGAENEAGNTVYISYSEDVGRVLSDGHLSLPLHRAFGIEISALVQRLSAMSS